MVSFNDSFNFDGSITFSYVPGYENAASARQVGVFVGLWAPTFGTLGVRAQLNEK